MSPAEWFRPPRHLLAMFFGITVISAAALGWLSWQLVRQDRALASQQAHENRATAARLVLAALQKDLSELEERLTSLANLPEADVPRAASELSQGLPADSVFVVFHSGGVDAYPSNQLLYYPVLPKATQAPANVFAEADAMEVRQKNFPGAIAVLKELTLSPDPLVRAEAYLRVGRNLRLAGRPEEAAAAYEQLGRIENASVPPGIPAGLAARVALISIFQRDRKERGAQEARALRDDLHRGRWRLEGAVYRSYASQVNEWLGTALPDDTPPADAVATAEAVETLWKQWQNDRGGNGRQIYRTEGRSVFLVARSSAERAAALVAGPRYVETRWLSELKTDLKEYDLTLADSEGHPVIGSPETLAASHSLLLGSETGLPWNLYARSADAFSNAGTFSRRTQLVIAGVCAIALLVVGGS
jgi:tetratricopeptide (TPR) repeat protein